MGFRSRGSALVSRFSPSERAANRFGVGCFDVFPVEEGGYCLAQERVLDGFWGVGTIIDRTAVANGSGAIEEENVRRDLGTEAVGYVLTGISQVGKVKLMLSGEGFHLGETFFGTLFGIVGVDANEEQTAIAKIALNLLESSEIRADGGALVAHKNYADGLLSFEIAREVVDFSVCSR